MNIKEIDVQDFVVKSEDFGIPQARHRVILIGIRSDIKKRPDFLQKIIKTTVFDVIADLPRLRSKVNKKDGDVEWLEIFKTNLSDLIGEISKVDSNSNLVKELKYYQHIKCIDGQPIIKKTKQLN